MKLKKKPSQASKAIQAAYNEHGGTNKAARKIGISNQLLSRWKRQGYVPFSRIVEVSTKLCCNPYQLNYKLRDLVNLCQDWGDCLP